MKGDGGAIGLFHDCQSDTQFLIVMPELARILSEFESILPNNDAVEEDPVFLHHETSKSFQQSFQKDVNSLFETLMKYGNPFNIQHESLLTLMSQDILDDSIKESILNLESKGLAQYKLFCQEVLEKGTKNLFDRMAKNLFPLMSTTVKRVSVAANRIKALKLNNELFSTAATLVKERDFNLSVLYNFEMHDYPPSLSNFGEMNTPTNKSLILNHIVTACHNAPPDLEGDGSKAALVIDGGSIPYQHVP